MNSRYSNWWKRPNIHTNSIWWIVWYGRAKKCCKSKNDVQFFWGVFAISWIINMYHQSIFTSSEYKMGTRLLCASCSRKTKIAIIFHWRFWQVWAKKAMEKIWRKKKNSIFTASYLSKSMHIVFFSIGVNI